MHRACLDPMLGLRGLRLELDSSTHSLLAACDLSHVHKYELGAIRCNA
jgi:hypothetical protein